MTLTIELSDEKYEGLTQMATNCNCSIDDMIEKSLDHMMTHKKKIEEIGANLMEKNAELYRRLA